MAVMLQKPATRKSVLKEKVSEWIDIKKKHPENFKVQRSEYIDSYVQNKIATIHDQFPKNPQKPDLDFFDDVFRNTIKEIDRNTYAMN
jgi:hypothetical protein